MKYIVTFVFCLFAFASKGQDLNLNQVISFINQPVKAVNDSLLTKGWVTHPELSGIQKNQLYRTFSYGNLAADSKQALAWFRVHADDEIVNQIYYQLPGLDLYNKLIGELKAISTEKKDSQQIDNKQIITYYQNADFTFETSVGGGTYTLMVVTNKAL
jgi:hypothetical protein